MKTQIFNFIATLSIVATFGTNVHGDTIVIESCDSVFTNAVAIFIGAVETNDFTLTSSSFSCGQINNNETICGADLLFSNNDNSVVSIAIGYSRTEFSAAIALTNLLMTTSSSGTLPPINTTYKTDFTVLSDENSESGSRHASGILLSTNIAADIRIGSTIADSSHILSQIIKKMEALRDCINIKTP